VTRPEHPRYQRSTDAAALQVKCPQCGAEPGQPCTYVWTLQTTREAYDLDSWLSPGVRRMVERYGQPTERPHNERRRAEYQRRLRGFNAGQAYRLRAWLLAYGDIFREDP
jgi:hypothetical protein